MAKRLPPAEDAIFTQLHFGTRQPSGAQIVLDGYTLEAEQLSQLRDSLRADGRSIISTGTSNDARRKDYNWRFKETVLLTKTISLDKPDAKSAPSNATANRATASKAKASKAKDETPEVTATEPERAAP